jgi:hypothetical protein
MCCPYGVFSSAGRGPRVGVAVDDGILDLAEALGEQWAVPSLNPFMAQGREAGAPSASRCATSSTDRSWTLPT